MEDGRTFVFVSRASPCGITNARPSSTGRGDAVLVVSAGLLLTAWIIGWFVFEIPGRWIRSTCCPRDGGRPDGRARRADSHTKAALASW